MTASKGPRLKTVRQECDEAEGRSEVGVVGHISRSPRKFKCRCGLCVPSRPCINNFDCSASGVPTSPSVGCRKSFLASLILDRSPDVIASCEEAFKSDGICLVK